MKKRAGFSFVEILTGVLVFAGLSLPIIWVMTSTRTDTSKAINYLRALELAQETLEWIYLTPVDSEFEKKVSSLNGSLLKNEGGGYTPSPVDVSKNPFYSGRLLNSLSYPVQYSNAYFLRTVDVSPVTTGPNAKRLKRVTVSIRWNEGKVPANLEVAGSQAEGARMRKVVLSVLVMDKNSI